ncbi:MAG: hypothetical protein GY821_07855 [Gammaproteobacteria bacterium]|nr:hypothetical protein [Gammaproteobacteria bacterium]
MWQSWLNKRMEIIEGSEHIQEGVLSNADNTTIDYTPPGQIKNSDGLSAPVFITPTAGDDHQNSNDVITIQTKGNHNTSASMLDRFGIRKENILIIDLDGKTEYLWWQLLQNDNLPIPLQINAKREFIAKYLEGSLLNKGQLLSKNRIVFVRRGTEKHGMEKQIIECPGQNSLIASCVLSEEEYKRLFPTKKYEIDVLYCDDESPDKLLANIKEQAPANAKIHYMSDDKERINASINQTAGGNNFDLIIQLPEKEKEGNYQAVDTVLCDYCCYYHNTFLKLSIFNSAEAATDLAMVAGLIIVAAAGGPPGWIAAIAVAAFIGTLAAATALHSAINNFKKHRELKNNYKDEQAPNNFFARKASADNTNGTTPSNGTVILGEPKDYIDHTPHSPSPNGNETIIVGEPDNYIGGPGSTPNPPVDVDDDMNGHNNVITLG